MAKQENLDPSTSFFDQLKEKTGPVVLANTFVVPEDDSETFLAVWKKHATFMKAQPGLLSLQMHRGTAGSRLFMNVAIWESTEALATALADPQFQAMAVDVPEDIVSYAHVFEKVAVEGLCVA
ncbi:antibiotic biosynthesis monooxygenase family protein [Streptomyces sp. NPDC004520]|uniref:antibiotic biosynthesis monooxygenase family protein n=1 Tax=unclassified Streptomyces TaxID=2593676 RepID=UPI0036AF4F2C